MINKMASIEKKAFNKERYAFLENFYRLMFELGLINKMHFTFKLVILDKTNYGFFAHLYLSPGLCFDDISTSLGKIQQGLLCIWIMKVVPFKEYAEVKIVTKPLDAITPFENPDLKPYELYLGLDFSLKPIKINVNRYCHFLIAGATGAGKTRLQYMMLLAWIMNCDIREVEVFLADIAKDGFAAFEHVKHIRYYATEIEELHKMLKYIDSRITKRKRSIGELRAKGLATNIEEFNKIEKHKMSYIYVLIDEFSVIIPDNSDNREEKAIKQECLDIVKRIVKIGREMGVFAIIGVQKTVKDELPSIIKNMSAVRISFRANDAISSEVIMGDRSAVGLADRYAIYSLNGGEQKDYLFSPNLSTEKLNELLKPYIDYKRKKVNLNIDDNIIESSPRKVYPVPNSGPEIKKGTPYEVINTNRDYEVI